MAYTVEKNYIKLLSVKVLYPVAVIKGRKTSEEMRKFSGESDSEYPSI